MVILLNKEREGLIPQTNEISSQNLVKTLHTFYKMICKSKQFFSCGGPFPRYARKFLRIDFVLLIRTLYQMVAYFVNLEASISKCSG